MASSQYAVNHTVSGVRVWSKIVPAVTDVRRWQAAHSSRPIAQPPALDMTARRAGEPARPAQPLQVVQAVRVNAEPRLELARRRREVNSSAGLIHARILFRLSEYPEVSNDFR
jgi:hypothetical protein